MLTEKYRFCEKEARAFSDFLEPMLRLDPNKRASAQEMLRHPWLQMPADYDTKVKPGQDASTIDFEHDYYYKQEMSKLTDGSDNDLADNEFAATGFFSSDDDEMPFTSNDRFERDPQLKRNMAEGMNLNNSFGQYDPEDFDHLHRDKGANPQFINLLEGGK